MYQKMRKVGTIAIQILSLTLLQNTAFAQSPADDIVTLQCFNEFGGFRYIIDTKRKSVKQSNTEDVGWSTPTAWRQGKYSTWNGSGYNNYISSFGFKGNGIINYTWSPQDENYYYWNDYITIDTKNGTLTIRHTVKAKKDGVYFLDDKYEKPLPANQALDRTEKTTCDMFRFPFKRNPESFANYLSRLTWGDGKRRFFQNLGGCSSEVQGIYDCRYGYVKINDPVNGSRFCELVSSTSISVVKYTIHGGSRKGYVDIGRLGDCRKAWF